MWSLPVYSPLSIYVHTKRAPYFWFVEYNALSIYRGPISLQISRKTPHSSPVRARYGMSFVNAKSVRCLIIVTIVLCVLSCCRWPRYIECLWCDSKLMHVRITYVCVYMYKIQLYIFVCELHISNVNCEQVTTIIFDSQTYGLVKILQFRDYALQICFISREISYSGQNRASCALYIHWN